MGFLNHPALPLGAVKPHRSSQQESGPPSRSFEARRPSTGALPFSSGPSHSCLCDEGRAEGPAGTFSPSAEEGPPLPCRQTHPPWQGPSETYPCWRPTRLGENPCRPAKESRRKGAPATGQLPLEAFRRDRRVQLTQKTGGRGLSLPRLSSDIQGCLAWLRLLWVFTDYLDY